MTFRQFVVPDEDDILTTLGVESEAVEDDEVVRRLSFSTDADSLDFVYGVHGRWVRIRWSHGDAVLIDMTREGAVQLRVEWTDQKGFIHVEFDTDELAGKLTLQVHPAITLTDSMLLT